MLGAMNTELYAILGVGVALAGLLIRMDFRISGKMTRLETRLSDRMNRLEGRMERLEDRLAKVEQDQARLQGLLEGLRDWLSSKAAS